MAAAIAPPPLQTALADLCTDAAMPESLQEFLRAKGIVSAATLAAIAADVTELYTKLFDPYNDGVDISGTNYKRPQEVDEDVSKTTLRCVWEDAVRARQARCSAIVAAPGAGAATAIAVAPQSSSTKPPTTLPKDCWSNRIRKFNAVTINGSNREFRENTLTGAETVLARLWHEHHVTHMYTALKLGEILQQRCFTSLGDLNPMAVRDRTVRKLGTDHAGDIVEREPDVWNPRSMTAILDGLEAARWAYVFVELGAEVAIDRWIEWFTKHTRKRGHDLDSIVRLWNAASWRIALEMRRGDSFDAATATLMNDFVFVQETLTAKAATVEEEEGPWTPNGRRNKRNRWEKESPEYRKEPRREAGSKGKGKGKPQKDTIDRTGKYDDPCPDYQLGRCNRKDCWYKHVCGICRKPNHVSSGCWWAETKKADTDQTAAKGSKGTKGGKGSKSKGSKGKSQE